jgi:putative spermidine/putrescine transport system permease protein
MLLVMPALVFTLACFLLPVLALLLEAFQIDGGAWGLQRFVAFFGDPLNRQVFLRTLRIAVLVTLSAVLLGFRRRRRRPRWRRATAA